jgi:DNA-binding NtrC family response regulator
MRVLIIGDLDGQIASASRMARNRGAKVSQVSNIESAMQMLCDGNGADLLLVEIHNEIAKLAQSLAEAHINVPIVACGIHADAKQAADAIRAGAKEYLPLPPDEELIAAVLEAISQESHDVIHGSDAMRETLRIAEQIAPSNASVLITGESGTGKEVVARYIHQKSTRASKPFIAVNCAAIPENLMESELFGHEKGAFTGATQRRIGKFEEANQGTLLLDEISEMNVGLQAKLLRAIQEREIDRVGGTKPVKIDIRILATSNRDLLKEVKQGNFREDLYFRLNVINLNLPSLNARVGDIEPLSEYFIEKYSKANGMPTRKLNMAALAKLKAYSWPGNVRELENIMHRAVLMAQGNYIDADALMLPVQTSDRTATPVQPAAAALASNNTAPDNTPNAPRSSDMVGRTVEQVERTLILDTLDHCLGNRTQAAQILGISIRTLRNKLKIYNDVMAKKA